MKIINFVLHITAKTMKLRTEIKPNKLAFNIDHTQQGLSLGSCFADNIATKLMRLKFPILANPFGTLYNPLSIYNSLVRLEQNKPFTEDELFNYNGLWHSAMHHGDFSGEDISSTLDQINTLYNQAVSAFQKSDYLIITFGTTWVYRELESQQVVSNCHKLPAKQFTRERLSFHTIFKLFSDLLTTSLQGKRIIFTVSPIRHIKDGLVENSLSKATLIAAIHALRDMFPSQVDYFPSYEIMMDDLRDYRFYKEDMLHPSDQAINYIWEQFSLVSFTSQTLKLNTELQSIVQASEHRVLKPQSASHGQFCKKTLTQIDELEVKHPYLDLSKEKKHFRR